MSSHASGATRRCFANRFEVARRRRRGFPCGVAPVPETDAADREPVADVMSVSPSPPAVAIGPFASNRLVATSNVAVAREDVVIDLGGPAPLAPGLPPALRRAARLLAASPDPGGTGRVTADGPEPNV